MIGICGASGTIGSRVAAALRQQGVPLRALVRARNPTSELSADSVAVDLSDPTSVAVGLQGVKTLFLLCPNGPKQLEMEFNVVQAAVTSGVQRIVKLSVFGAAPDSPIEFGRLHGQVEDAIRASGCAWTFLRPNMFMQNLFWYKSALRIGVLPLPLGPAAVSHVDADNVGAAAAAALLDGSHAGKTLTLTGPEALTGVDVASILSSVLGRNISYQPVGSSEFRAYLKSIGESDYAADAEVELFSFWSGGHGREVSNALMTLTGERANTFEQFALREKAQFVEQT